MTGYRAMLRDRMPLIMNLALLYCKAKEDWIEHCYNNFIRVVPQSERSTTVKEMLGLAKRPGCKKIFTQDDYLMFAMYGYKKKEIEEPDKTKLYYTFKETIDWDELSADEIEFWEGVNDIVNWFSNTYTYIENDYRISIATGKNEQQIKEEIISRYKLDVGLANYLIKCFKKYD